MARALLRPTDPRNPAPTSLATRAIMLANRGRDTALELAFRRAIRERGVRGYRLNARTPAGRPDLVFARSRLAVFVHGCFWHRCPECRYPLPRSHRRFWIAKFRRNRARDRARRRTLEALGWTVLEIWGHEIDRTPERAASKVVSALRRAGDP